MAEPKPSARRSMTPADTTDAPSDAYGLVVRGIEAVEGVKASVAALEKSVDTVVARSDKLDEQLQRIARAEEERNQLARDASAKRDAWAGRLWSSPAVQYVIMALIAALTQFLGVSWLSEKYAQTVTGVAHEQAK